MQNRDGVGRRSQSYLPTLVEQALDNAARLIHEYRLPDPERPRAIAVTCHGKPAAPASLFER
jgi:hypothetical protein